MDILKLSENELERMIAAKYGENWSVDDLEDNDELVKAFFDKIATAID